MKGIVLTQVCMPPLHFLHSSLYYFVLPSRPSSLEGLPSLSAAAGLLLLAPGHILSSPAERGNSTEEPNKEAVISIGNVLRVSSELRMDPTAVLSQLQSIPNLSGLRQLCPSRLKV